MHGIADGRKISLTFKYKFRNLINKLNQSDFLMGNQLIEEILQDSKHWTTLEWFIRKMRWVK